MLGVRVSSELVTGAAPLGGDELESAFSRFAMYPFQPLKGEIEDPMPTGPDQIYQPD
jgi:hypothetical protein